MYGVECTKNNGLDNRFFRVEVVPKCQECFYAIKDEIIINDNIVYSRNRNFNKFKDSRIIIIGGGGSTNRHIDFNGLKANYDFIWSLNEFFLHPKLKNIKVDLISLGPDFPYEETLLNDYLQEFEPLVGFELHLRWAQFDGRQKVIKKINEEFYNTDMMFFFQTKWYSMLGGGVRLIILAAELGVSSVDFIGFDGYQAGLCGDHAFKPGTVSIPSRSKMFSDPHKEYLREYTVFWQYIKNMYPVLKVNSIDKDNIYHEALRET